MIDDIGAHAFALRGLTDRGSTAELGAKRLDQLPVGQVLPQVRVQRLVCCRGGGELLGIANDQPLDLIEFSGVVLVVAESF